MNSRSILAKLRERTSRIHVSHRDKYDEVKKQFCRSFIRICIVLFTWLYSTGTVQGIRIDCYSIFTVCKFNAYSDWKLKYAGYCQTSSLLQKHWCKRCHKQWKSDGFFWNSRRNHHFSTVCDIVCTNAFAIGLMS